MYSLHGESVAINDECIDEFIGLGIWHKSQADGSHTNFHNKLTDFQLAK